MHCGKCFFLVIVISKTATVWGPGTALVLLLLLHPEEAHAQELLLLALLSDDSLQCRNLIFQRTMGRIISSIDLSQLRTSDMETSFSSDPDPLDMVVTAVDKEPQPRDTMLSMVGT
jgi:hypothetical protein